MSLNIAVFSDVICPWCYVGKRRLERAVDELGLRSITSVHWLPFELNPDMPEDGVERSAYRRAKFGAGRSAQLDQQMRAIGRDEGITFAFDRMLRTPNTRRAHMLIAHATGREKGGVLVDALFKAYFEEARDIGQPDVLVEIAVAIGLNPEEAYACLGSDILREQVISFEQRAREMNISGVPFFVVDGKWTVSGAQPSEQWAAVLQEAARGSNEPQKVA
jgi:predicted DsbA family dithiol-disulfide isomerase